MPEEINRILTDQISDLLFVTEPNGLQNLRSEGVPAERIHFVGNTMIDSLLAFKTRAESSFILDELGLRSSAGHDGDQNAIRRYALLTLHRPSNVDHRDSFLNILAGLEELARDYPVIFPVHPRTQKRLEEFGLAGRLSVNGSSMHPDRGNSRNGRHGIILTPPMGYLDFLCLLSKATLVLTDSGLLLAKPSRTNPASSSRVKPCASMTVSVQPRGPASSSSRSARIWSVLSLIPRLGRTVQCPNSHI